MDYEYLCRERRKCRGQGSRGSMKLPADDWDKWSLSDTLTLEAS